VISGSTSPPDRYPGPWPSITAWIWRPQGNFHQMARGPACCAEPLIFDHLRRIFFANRKSISLENALEHQPACKPGSVGHRPFARTIRDGHSSGTTLARCLEQPTRTASLTSPCGVIACANSPLCRPYSVLLPVWFAMPVPLPDPRCALTAPFHPCCPSLSGWGKRFVLCGTVPGVAPAGCYPAPYVDGARTFLPRSLSAIAGAAVRPTDALGMGARDGRVKPITAAPVLKINYPEGVVLRLARSTGCRRSSRSRGVARCSIC
jgi:hypothetical protein